MAHSTMGTGQQLARGGSFRQLASTTGRRGSATRDAAPKSPSSASFASRSTHPQPPFTRGRSRGGIPTMGCACHGVPRLKRILHMQQRCVRSGYHARLPRNCHQQADPKRLAPWCRRCSSGSVSLPLRFVYSGPCATKAFRRSLCLGLPFRPLGARGAPDVNLQITSSCRSPSATFWRRLQLVACIKVPLSHRAISPRPASRPPTSSRRPQTPVPRS